MTKQQLFISGNLTVESKMEDVMNEATIQQDLKLRDLTKCKFPH